MDLFEIFEFLLEDIIPLVQALLWFEGLCRGRFFNVRVVCAWACEEN